jgi:hypothetical protein
LPARLNLGAGWAVAALGAWQITPLADASLHLRRPETVDLAVGLLSTFFDAVDLTVGWTRRTAPGAVSADSGFSLGVAVTVAGFGASFARVTGVNALGPEDYWTAGHTFR